MSKRVLFLFFVLLTLLMPLVFAETIEISTYYPAPYGVYVELRSQRMAIGDNYYDPTTLSWEVDGGAIPDVTNLVVEGNVGIGTWVPTAMVQIRDEAWISGTPHYHLLLDQMSNSSLFLGFKNTNTPTWGLAALPRATSNIALFSLFYEDHFDSQDNATLGVLIFNGDGNISRMGPTTGYGSINLGLEIYSGATKYNSEVTAGYSAVLSGGYNRVWSSGSTIAGGAYNGIAAAGACSFIGGGILNGSDAQYSVITGGYINFVYPGANFTTISGGYSNNILERSEYSVIAGGSTNYIHEDTTYSTISGGVQNQIFAAALGANISGGASNQIASTGVGSVVGGGAFNMMYGQTSVIGGGYLNQIASTAAIPTLNSVISGGYSNYILGEACSISGGDSNIAAPVYATVGGGNGNWALNGNTTVGGGASNYALSPNSVVAGGSSNIAGTITVDHQNASVGGGYLNQATGINSTISGGMENEATGSNDVVSGGLRNIASGGNSNVGGGQDNGATGVNSTVGGGLFNVATGSNATVPGGKSNFATGMNAVAMGVNAAALHDNSFVWGCNDNPAVFISAGAGTVNFYSTQFRWNGAIILPPSDKRLKKDINAIEGALDKVERLQGVMFKWKDAQYNYSKHTEINMGLIAQDVENVIPEVVFVDANGNYNVEYDKLVPLLVEAIKEQQKQINDLKQRL